MAEKQGKPEPCNNSQDPETSETQEVISGRWPNSENKNWVSEHLKIDNICRTLVSRFPAFFFKFQFRNVEYSSGRNKTFLCFVMDLQGKETGIFRGYLEDEHISAHAEEAFFNAVLPECKSGVKYQVTWYVSSSPCVACAERIAGVLKKNKNLRLMVLVGRLFMCEEPEIQDSLRKLKAAGCKMKIMGPQDFEFVWQNFVEQEEGQEGPFVPWEDMQENFLYYEEKLAEILQ